jgi:hypothetical protein
MKFAASVARLMLEEYWKKFAAASPEKMTETKTMKN